MLHKKLYRVDAELHAHPLDLLETQWPEVAMHSNTGTPFARFCSGSPVSMELFCGCQTQSISASIVKSSRDVTIKIQATETGGEKVGKGDDKEKVIAIYLNIPSFEI